MGSIAGWLFQLFVMWPLLLLRRIFVAYTAATQLKRTEKRYLAVLDATEDQKTWNATALNLDLLRGFASWHKQIPATHYCNPGALIYETNAARRITSTGNVRAMGEFLRTMLHRRGNGVASPLLFRYYTGTKLFVENYTNTVCSMIEQFSGSTQDSTNAVQPGSPGVQANGSEVELTVRSEFVESIVKWAELTQGRDEADMALEERYKLLTDTLHSYGRTALMLSGGASLGMYHVGVVRALFERQLLPKIVSGSSAGAIIAGIVCTRTESDLADLLVGNGISLHSVKLDAFEVYDSPEESIGKKVDRLLTSGAFMDVKTLMECLRTNVGDVTFLEAYQRTGRILNVSVANNRPGNHIDKHMLLNYVTSPNVVVWSAIAASCAMPGLFTAVQLLEKNPGTAGGEPDSMVPYLPGQLWFDGSVARDLPKEELSTMFNANYFIVSQTNPHVIPFLKKPPSPIVHKKRTSTLKRIWFSCCSEARHWLMKFYRLGVLPKSGGAEVPYLMATQSYDGDITILPIGSVWAAIPDFINLTSNPTEEHMQYVISNAQRRTWPHLNQIKWVTKIERTLLKELESLHARIVAGGCR